MIYVNEISNELFLPLLDNENNFQKNNIRSIRSFVAEIVESNTPLVISKKFYERFVLNASSSANGFRMRTLEKLLEAIDVEFIDLKGTAQDLWTKINESHELIEKQVEKYHKNGLIYLNDEGKKIVERTKNIYDANLVIVDTNITNSYTNEIRQFLS